MPRGSDPAPSRTEIPAGLREKANRARRLARDIADLPAKANLIAFAEEMEAMAAALEPPVSVQTISHSDAVAVQRSDPDAGKDGRS